MKSIYKARITVVSILCFAFLVLVSTTQQGAPLPEPNLSERDSSLKMTSELVNELVAAARYTGTLQSRYEAETTTLRAPSEQAPSVPVCWFDVELTALNKAQYLSESYVPSDLTSLNLLGVRVFGNAQLRLRQDAALSYAALERAAQSNQLQLMVVSAFRSNQEQRYLFNRAVQAEQAASAQVGISLTPEEAGTLANRYIARPGQSEHQLGTALDLSTAQLHGVLTRDLSLTEAGTWLRTHAQEFGFVISYPEGKELITGYASEPWHLRWVGRVLAQDLYAQQYLDPRNDVTLSNYLRVLFERCKQPPIPNSYR